MLTRHQRKLKKYSISFNNIFEFFLSSYRSGLITFCGIDVVVEFDINGVDAKEGFRLFEDGHFKNSIIKSRHPNLLKSVIIGKKGWGLWVQEWSNGIADFTFTKEEILEQFHDKNIVIPDSFLKDLDNVIKKKKNLRY